MGEVTKKTTQNAVAKNGDKKYEAALIEGDLSLLSSDERVQYYNAVCKSTGLNPLTKPFEYVKLNGQLRLYARRDATDQLRKIYGVDIEIISKQQVGDLYMVEVRATDKTGRKDSALGAVSIKGLGGELLANALMKAESKAKRRVTLSLCGLGMLDETEVESVQRAEDEKAPTLKTVADAFKQATTRLGLPLASLRDFAKKNGIGKANGDEIMTRLMENEDELQALITAYLTEEVIDGEIE